MNKKTINKKRKRNEDNLITTSDDNHANNNNNDNDNDNDNDLKMLTINYYKQKVKRNEYFYSQLLICLQTMSQLDFRFDKSITKDEQENVIHSCLYGMISEILYNIYLIQEYLHDEIKK